MKAWHNEIDQHILEWSRRLGNLGWWPKYVYHFTDVQNAARILADGVLYCRNEAANQGRMIVDNASSEIIAQTRSEHMDFVRLYFRPKTPTQYRNEGIRPRAARSLSSHCPVPVYFCFDASGLLAQDDVEFSNGNMATARVEHGSERDFFLGIPFETVFHNGAFSPEERDEVIFRRNAEVLVPGRLRLKPHLRFVACRSEPERQTLLHLLPKGAASNWKDKIRLGEQGFFERRWTYVEEVVAFDGELTFRFNPSSKHPGPFDVKVEYREGNREPARRWERTVNSLRASLRLRAPEAATWGEARLYLDDALAFSDIVLFEDIPF